MKIEWELYPIYQYLEHVVKIFQIRRVCAKKINDNPCIFLVSKVAFYGAYDQYKLCFKQPFVKIAFLAKRLAPYCKAKRQKIHTSEMVHPRMISLAESRGSSRFLNT